METLEIERFGTKLRVANTNLNSHYWQTFSTWEEETFNFILPLLSRDKTFIDVGAWIGPISLIAAYRSKQCLCFEPDPIAAEELQTNVHLNSANNIKIHQTAVSPNRTIKLGASKLGESITRDSCDQNAIEVTCTDFETILRENELVPNKISCIKIDVEGHERKLLKEKSILWDIDVPMHISMHPGWFEDKEQFLKDITPFLKAKGIDTSNLSSKGDFFDVSINRKRKPILVISAGRRLEYLTRTIRSLCEKNPTIQDQIQTAWLLDDRSTPQERMHAEILMRSYLGNECQTVNFNSERPLAFVDKLNFIRKVTEPDDIVLLLEDDWECQADLEIERRSKQLADSDWTQIAFADPLWIQDQETQNMRIDNEYWKNPYPNEFRHPHAWENGTCFWNTVRVNNWTNNPSLVKASVFHLDKFENKKNFEAIFADCRQRNQVFTTECLFNHFGHNSIINKI